MDAADRLPTVADVEAAAAWLRDVAVRTPLLQSEAQNEQAGGRPHTGAARAQRSKSPCVGFVWMFVTGLVSGQRRSRHADCDRSGGRSIRSARKPASKR
jgi:hypothetical protein